MNGLEEKVMDVSGGISSGMSIEEIEERARRISCLNHKIKAIEEFKKNSDKRKKQIYD